MSKHQQEQQTFLLEQVEWCKKQDSILEQIESKLYEMKGLAEYARDNKLTIVDTSRLNEQLKILKEDIKLLEQEFQSLVH